MASPFQKETSKKQPAKARTIVSLSYPFAQSCPTLCNPMDYSPPGSSVHGILQAGVLEWVSIAFSRGSSQLRDWTWVSHIPGRCFNLWATREECLSRPEQFCAVTMKGGSCSLSRVWLCNSTDCGPPGSSVHGISQARIPEQVATSSSTGSS